MGEGILLVTTDLTGELFELIGLDACILRKPGDGEKIEKRIRGYNIIIVEERLAEKIRRVAPEEALIVVLPNLDTFRSGQLDRLREEVSRSLGVRLKWRG